VAASNRREPSEELSEELVAADPVEQFRRWYDLAVASGEPEPDAMALATVGAGGVPAVRFVLLKGVDDRGFVFYTNCLSRKGREIAANPVAALALRWAVVGRQVRIAGPVVAVEAAESDVYFATRPRGAQLGAWASAQSEPIGGRQELESQVAEVAARFAGAEIPRPAWWGGFRVVPTEVELWQNRPDRLHDRIRYKREQTGWTIERLSP
jgi:pyridoxamine 5'-phosphate oxidase